MGQTATNPTTGEKLVFDITSKSWIPVGKTATNKETGERLAWSGNAWVSLEPPMDDLTRAMRIAQTGIMEAMGLPSQIVKSFIGNIRRVPEGLPPGAVIPETAPIAFPETAEAIPTAEEATTAISEFTGLPLTQPQEASGRILKETLKGATVGVPFGVAGGVGGALAGTGSQTAAELGAPPWVQMVAGLGLPLLAGGLSTSLRSIAPAAEKQLGQALQGVTREELFAAETAMRKAQQARNPITWSEALNSVSGGKYPELAQLQRTVEQTSGGGKTLARVMGQRLEAARTQAESNLDKIGPKLEGQAAIDVPENLNAAARAAISRELAEMRRTTRPLFAQAAADTVPADQMQRIVARVDQEIAQAGSADVKNQLIAFRRELVDAPATSATAAPLQGITGVSGRAATPETFKLDIGRLDSIRRAWRDRIELPDPAINAAAPAKEVGARLGPILSDLRETMKRSSAAFKTAREFHETTMNAVIAPLRRAPTGKIAESPAELPTQRQKLLPTGEQGTVTPQSVSDTVKRLEREKPGSAAAWLRQNLESQFDDILKAMQSSGSDASRGTSLWARLVGNETQRANLKAYVEALPGGKDTWQGFEAMLDTLEAQRFRLPANSATSFNTETLKALQSTGLPFDFSDLNPISLFQSAAKEAGKARRLRLNSEKLANTLLDVGARQRLAQLAKLKPGTREARRLVGSILALTASEENK